MALIGYFAPWIHRRPMSAALAWNAYDLFALLRLLPEIEAGTLAVNLQALQLPLLGLAVLLPTLLARRSLGLRLAAALFGSGLALMTLPPYPQILTAWRTPGWRVPFWWGVGCVVLTCAAAWIAPAFGRAPALQKVRAWWVVGAVELATIPAALTLVRLLPALSRLHAVPVTPGWGFWSCLAGLTLLGIAGWVRTVRVV